MSKNLKKCLSLLIVFCLVAIGSVNYTDAASNHLLIINSKKNTMAYYVNNDLVREFRVATGKSSTPTPTGKFNLVNKIKNRPYYSGGIPGGSPNNPLGDRWLGLHVGNTYGTTYAIHGNNDESSIGKHISGGCVRMHNSEVRWLFDRVPTGTTVIIKSTDQSYEQIAAGYNIKLNKKANSWEQTNNKWYYVKSNNNYAKSEWLQLSGKWYYFDNNGVMQTGWQQLGTKWYYMNNDGVMQTGWQKVGTKWYYMNQDGVMQTGWQKVGNKWYYLNNDGVMQTGWQKVGTKWYYMNNDGVMQTGWQQLGNKWYYMNNDGVMQTGWQQLGSKWYYMNNDGVMQTGWQQLGSKWYYMNNDGVMQIGTIEINGKSHQFNDKGEWIEQ